MAFSEVQFTTAVKAGVDMENARFRLIRVQSGAANTTIICSVASERVDGIMITNPRSGEFGAMAYGGVVKYRAGGAVSAGMKIRTNATGYGVESSTTSGNSEIGVSLTTVVSGAVGSMLIQKTYV